MVNCAVPSCKNDSRRQTKQKSNVTFHRFPRNEELLKKWVDAVKRADWEPTIRSFVCSAHFPEPSMYLSKSGLRKLVQDAVPELMIHNEPQKRKKKKTKSKSKVTKTYTTERKSFSLDKVKKEHDSRTDSDSSRKLKKRIANLTKLSKRRRLRCNALYASLNRIRKKVANMVVTLKGLQSKISENEELGPVLESYGVSPTELFQGLGNRERSASPEAPEDEFFYAETLVELEASPPSTRHLTVRTSSYPPLPWDCPVPPPAGDLSQVKTEEASPLASPAPVEVPDVVEPVFVDTNVTNATCHVCLQSSAPPVAALEPDLRPLYELMANTKLLEAHSPGLCRSCRAVLQRCRAFAELAHSAETFHTQEAVIKMAEQM